MFTNPNNKHDMLVQIFNQQRSHMEKYAEIEDSNGLLQTPDIPVNLQDRFGQARLKDFAWRITEEMGEALEEVYNGGTLEAYHEEMSDVLHFLTEFTILAGLEPKDLITLDAIDDYLFLFIYDYLFLLYAQAEQNIPESRGREFNYSDITFLTGLFVQKLAMTSNLLKNKPWKQSERPTDPETFKERLIGVWETFISICMVINVGPEKLHQLYFRKSDINKKRQETGY